MKKRAIVYVDGYNWYHAIFKYRPEWKWLNLQTFFQALRPHEDIVAVKFFTAIVDEQKASDAKERQLRYLSALATLPKVRTILGKFQDREVTCRADCKRKYIVAEEKKTDVNIAVQILSDVIKAACDSVIVVSGDSDVQPPVEWVNTHHPQIKIMIYVPAMPPEQASRRLDYYRQIRVQCSFLPLDGIKDHQLKSAIRLPNGNFLCRPSAWSVES